MSEIVVKHPEEGETKLQLRLPRAGDVKKGFQLLVDIEQQSNNDEGTETTALIDYLDFLDEMSARGVGKTTEWLEALPDDDQNQITKWYHDRVQRRADFMKPSDSQQN